MAKGRGEDPFEGRVDCHSEHSQASSHIGRPKWRRLVRAAAFEVAQLLLTEVSTKTKGQLISEEAFTSLDAGGGGSPADVYNCLIAILEAMSLSDEDTGTVVVGMYYFLKAEDLPLSSATWRGLTVTAVAAAVRFIFKSKPEGFAAIGKLQSAVVHWWPEARFSRAYEEFTKRETFRKSQLTQACRVEIYFKLRDRGLHLATNSESGATAEFDFEHLASSKLTSGDTPKQPAGGAPRTRPEPIMGYSESSLGYSENSAMHQGSFEEKSPKGKQWMVSI